MQTSKTYNENPDQGNLVIYTSSHLNEANTWASQDSSDCAGLFAVSATALPNTAECPNGLAGSESIWTLDADFDRPGVVDKLVNKGIISRISNLLVINTTSTLSDETAVLSFLKESITAVTGYYVKIIC